MLLKLYLTSEKDIPYYQFVVKAKLILIVESIVLVFASVILYAFLNSILILFPFILAMANLFIVLYKIREAKWESQGKSIKFRIECSIYKLFLSVDKLCKKMKANKMPEEEIETTKKKYVEMLKSEKTQANINAVTKEVNVEYQNLTGEKMEEIKSMDIEAFSKKEAKKWTEKYYPEFNTDMKNNEYSKVKARQQKQVNSIIRNDIHVEQALKTLGLPGTTTDMTVVKNKYFELIKRYHPDSVFNKDKSKEEIQEKIIEINLAYQEIERAFKNNN